VQAVAAVRVKRGSATIILALRLRLASMGDLKSQGFSADEFKRAALDGSPPNQTPAKWAGFAAYRKRKPSLMTTGFCGVSR
jgi:hypothetical protein